MDMHSQLIVGPRAGACSDDIAHFCTVIKPGEGRVYECLKTQREAEKMGNSDGRFHPIATRSWVSTLHFLSVVNHITACSAPSRKACGFSHTLHCIPPECAARA